jgi:hypothetical protein
MDHQQALETGAVEQYLLGQLDSETRDAFEEHFFDCVECAGDVRETARFLDDTKELLAGEPVVAPAWAQERLRRRSWSGWFWPMPVGALAASLALLVVAGYQAAIVAPRLKQEAARAESIQAVPWTFLSVSRAAPQVITVSRAERQVGITLSRSALASFTHYRCTLSKADGGAVLSAVVAAPPTGEELQLLLPLARLTPSDYVLIVSGMASETADATDPQATQYHFSLRYREGAL